MKDLEEFLEEEPPLLVFDRDTNEEAVPKGFNAATIYLDAKPSSILKWDEEIEAAKKLASDGLRILFDIDFGTFSKPLSHAGQFQACRCALDHFREAVWPQFREVSVGAVLHRSSLTFDKNFPQEEKSLFLSRDACIEYFELLASFLPDSCEPFLFFDCKETQDPFLFALLAAQDRYLRFRLALANAPLNTSFLTWKEGAGQSGYIGRALPTKKPHLPTVALLLPPFKSALPEKLSHLQEIMQELLKREITFKTISEEFLTMEWEGLDVIILSSETIPLAVERALDGFSAACGTVISNMNSFRNWLSIIDGKAF